MLSLRSARLVRPLSQQLSRTARTGFRTAERQPWQRVSQRRGYASGHDDIQSGSDIPWAIGAVGVTAIALFWLAPWDSPSHGDGHGEHGGHGESHEEKEEGSEEESASEEKPEEKSDEGDEKPKDDNSSDKPDDGDSGSGGDGGGGGDGGEGAKKDDAPKEESKDDSKDDSKDESKDDSKGDSKDEEKSGANKKDGVSQLSGERKTEPSGKSDSGTKRRIDSDRRTRQGAASDEDAIGGSYQTGMSNAPTMYSVDIGKDTEHSTKKEGAPETAKLPAPVNPGR